MSLALSTVLYEWRRYLAAVVALAASGCMVLVLVGLFVGIVESVTATIDRSPADLMVLPAKATSLLGTGGMPRRVMPLIYLNPEVVDVADMDDGGGMFSNLGTGKQKIRTYVQIMAVDTAPGSLTLPSDFDDNVRLALSQPYAIAVDKTALGRLGVKLGDHAALNGHEVIVAATVTGYPSINMVQLVASRATLRLLKEARPDTRVGPMLVKIRDPARAAEVRDQLNAVAGDQYRAWTKPELAVANRNDLMKEQIIGIVLGFAMFMGAAVGIVITWQTLRAAILANVKEFASLRALGVAMGSLGLVVMEMSFWVGIAGLFATALLVSAIWAVARSANVPMGFPVGFVIFIAVSLVLIAVVSGFFSLGVLKKSQPADLLR
jgi:putative ABC transport system permease protein